MAQSPDENAEKAKKTEKAREWCRQYLKGTWATIDRDEITVEPFSGNGLSNYLYKCSIPSRKDSTTPKMVLARIYGNVLDNPGSMLLETAICTLLAERNAAPKIYGICQEGRLEEFVQSRTLCVDDLRKGNFTVEIARKLASYHLMDMPLRKQPVFLLETCENWLASIPETFDNADHNTKLQELLAYGDGLKGELEYVKELLGHISSPSVFSHNDLNEGNVLSIERTGQSKGDKPIVFIDFEYASYNYRGYDIANFFCEWTFDYSSKEFPCFKYSPEDYPTKEQQLKFIRAYLDCYNEYKRATVEGKEKMEFDLLTEVEKLTIPCHFFWVLWSIVQQKKSQHEFGFLDYALTRMEIYTDLKKKFIDPSESKL